MLIYFTLRKQSSTGWDRTKSDFKNGGNSAASLGGDGDPVDNVIKTV